MSGLSIMSGGGHLGDEILMQLLDREPGSPDGAHEHLESCPVCTERMSVLHRAADALRAGLPDVVMPRLNFVAPKRRRWMLSFPAAAAASLVVLASAAAATPPVRAWVLRQFASDTPPAPLSTTPPASVPSANAAGIIASFVPADTALVIQVDRRQAGGALELNASTGDRISAQAVGGSAAEELLVQPGQLRIANATTSVADYRITIPTSVRVVRVMLGGNEVAVVRIAAGLHRRIELR